MHEGPSSSHLTSAPSINQLTNIFPYTACPSSLKKSFKKSRRPPFSKNSRNGKIEVRKISDFFFPDPQDVREKSRCVRSNISWRASIPKKDIHVHIHIVSYLRISREKEQEDKYQKTEGRDSTKRGGPSKVH